VVIAKGGVTSAVTLLVGFRESEADVQEPVLPGVSHWRAGDDGGAALDYVRSPATT
jgi:hypothetical protein